MMQYFLAELKCELRVRARVSAAWRPSEQARVKFVARKSRDAYGMHVRCVQNFVLTESSVVYTFNFYVQW